MIAKLKISLCILFWFNLSLGVAQDYVIPFDNKKTEARIISKSQETTRMVFTLDGILGNKQTNKYGEEFTELYFGQGYSKGEIGTPKLPAFKKLIRLPHGAKATVNVLGYSTEIINLNQKGITKRLYPNQPSLRKDKEIEEEPFYYIEEAYKKEGFPETPIASIEVLGNLRGVTIARLEVYPVNYDPASSNIKVHNDIEVEIMLSGVSKLEQQAVTRKTYSPYFEPVYNSLTTSLSENIFDSHPDLTKYPVKMLVVSHRMFEETLIPLVEWKTKKGFYVEVAFTDEIGTEANQIKEFIHGKYNSATEEDPAPTFLVIVGDIQQVPASSTGSSSKRRTDLYYASVDGDYFPDMYYGRLSAQNTSQLKNILDKILYYEKYQFEDPTYLNNVTLIAGTDGTWNPRIGEPTVKYGTQYHFNSENGFDKVWGYGVADDPNNPNNSSGYSGSYDNERISVSLINYTAHCSETVWDSPRLNITSINSMTNANKYPVAIGNCCLSADFGYGESIGEAWIRAENKGAVAYIGSSPNSYWFEDFYWAVGAFPIQGNNNGYVPTYDETTLGVYDAPFNSDYLSTSGLVFVGNLAVTEVDIQGYASHSSPLYYWEAYNVLGDPSLIPYLTDAEENSVTHLPILPIGLETYTISALPGSYVAVSKDGILHGAALVDGTGEVEVLIEPILEGGDVDIVVTRPQTIPYMVQVPAATLEGPFVVLGGLTINDDSGNNNGLVDYGETFMLNITLKNVGADPAENVQATITGEDQFFTISGAGPISFGDISSTENENTSEVLSAFALSVAANVPDQHVAKFVVIAEDGENQWQSNLFIKANAPVIKIGSFSIDDGGEGIPGVLDPGETANINIQVSNQGHSTSYAANAMLATSSPYLTINGSNEFEIGLIPAGETVNAVFSVTANEETPSETPTLVNISVFAGEYSEEKELEIIVGYIPQYNISNSTVTACIGRFFDSGGPHANYSNNENYTMTFYPSNSDNKLAFIFSSFTIENGYDYLYIYDGESTSASQFEGSPYTGQNSPSTIVATNELGAITFRFTSDVNTTFFGWEAEFFCVNMNIPPDCATNPKPGINEPVETSPFVFEWEPVPNALDYEIYLGVEELPNEPTSRQSGNSIVLQVEPNTNYLWKVVPINQAGAAEGCPAWSFNTEDVTTVFNMQTASYYTCNALFYDSGGPLGAYQNNENDTLTVFPTNTTQKIKITFNSFDLESNWDYLHVYDGATPTAENKIVSLTGTSLPDHIIAVNPEGALTFVFISDGSITREGWEATLTCEEPVEETFTVSFIVTDGQGDAVPEAEIELNGYGSQTTNIQGKTLFDNVLSEEEIPYIVTHLDFHTHEGTLTVVDKDVHISIVITPLGTIETALSTTKVYPNPFDNTIVLSSEHSFKSVKLVNVMGQSVLHLNSINKSQLTLQTDMIKPGVYLLVTEFDTGKTEVIRVIKTDK